MTQSWLNVAGLTLDFVGVMLLAYEWSVALAAERREAEVEARRQMTRPHPSMPRSANPHQPVFDHMREQHEFNERRRRTSAARGIRRGAFVTALVLIAVGFLLQIAGSLPI
jgi:hypothetical protein